MISFTCRCGNALYFENTTCLQCGAAVGFDSTTSAMVAVDPGPGTVRCENGQKHGLCNWTVEPGQESLLCAACRLNRTIPDLSVADNLEHWRALESAKRRALHTLLRLHRFPPSQAEAPDGLAFDFLMPMAGQPVMTGHRDGVITLNVREADPAYREKQRRKLGEPYRTLVGHFRHELGHYIWARFFKGLPEDDARLIELRQTFGDERTDYAQALQRHYAEGAPEGWRLSHFSAYATCHPWEDWAETWAQYLHMLDGLETARHFGWDADRVPTPFTSLGAEGASMDPEFLDSFHAWARLSPAINELAAGLGRPDLFPFIFSTLNARKLLFVHRVVNGATVPAGV